MSKKVVQSRDLKQGLGFNSKIGLTKQAKQKKIKKLQKQDLIKPKEEDNNIVTQQQPDKNKVQVSNKVSKVKQEQEQGKSKIRDKKTKGIKKIY